MDTQQVTSTLCAPSVECVPTVKMVSNMDGPVDPRSVAYDAIFDEASEILKRDNPCEIGTDGKCLYGRRLNTTSFCCGGCKYLGPEGCTVKAVGCRVWLCDCAKRKHPQTYIALQDVKRRIERAGIPDHFRGSKEDHLNNTPIHPGRMTGT